jgi:glycosyltransferase involved in cell wall biosynthesis
MEKHFKDVFNIEKPIYVIPNMNDIADWDYKPAPKYKDRIVIGYSGSNSHQDDLLVVLPVINKLMGKYPNLWLEMIGAIEKQKLDIYFRKFKPKHLERIGMLPSTPTFWEYPPYLAKQKWDIGIAPLVDTPFTRSKSHIKWLEYSMYKIPTVASRVYPYFMELCGRDTITDGVTGFLCQTPQEWEMKLERLIKDRSLRKSIGQQAYDHVKNQWQYKDFNVEDIIDKILKQ